jgi:DNA-binding NtrC family response regulator
MNWGYAAGTAGSSAARHSGKEYQPYRQQPDYPVDVRIICATNKNLSEEMQKGNFRQDLFYRLNVIDLHILPLRERPEDILLLFHHFLAQLSSATHSVLEEELKTVCCLINGPAMSENCRMWRKNR